ncbi:MAG TPA: HNH endonuclease [candidate division CPR3 bacterium]|uniref:HNH endonuclease n=1 Tax=candidate division CPR3 bacterium TaxID=2268181 RepID=A0A7C1SX40_UNCC3|nr:HNH endonuclease [candidate division CPR3 bacterium]
MKKQHPRGFLGKSHPEEVRRKIGEGNRGKKTKWIRLVCESCGKDFEVTPYRKDTAKNCSLKCKHGVHGERMKEHYDRRGRITFVERTCENCEGLFQPHIANTRRGYGKYCSSKCYGEVVKGEKHHLWNNGSSFEPYGIDFNNKLREEIRKRDNYTCRECNFAQKQLGYKLSIHHIDYNKRNNRGDNLVSLCRGCHTQTNFGRDEWTKYFQGK